MKMLLTVVLSVSMLLTSTVTIVASQAYYHDEPIHHPQPYNVSNESFIMKKKRKCIKHHRTSFDRVTNFTIDISSQFNLIASKL